MTSDLDKLLQKAESVLADIGVKDNRNAFGETQNLIDMIRYALSFPSQQLGLWEAMELNAANNALEKGFFKLSIVFACRAIEVSYLEEEEYLFGFEAVRHAHQQPIEQLTVTLAPDTVSKEAARDLLWAQNSAAASLTKSQSSAAVHLFLTQRLAAESLVLVQTDAAQHLAAEDNHAASDLFAQQKNTMDIKNSSPAPRDTVLKEKDIEEFMRTGDYSIGFYEDKGIKVAKGLNEEIDVAIKLKAHQLSRATALRNAQSDAAIRLKSDEKDGARRLKENQKRDAIILAETNVLKALLKKKESNKEALSLNNDPPTK